MQVLGIDIGGSGIKAALVDVTKGIIIGEKHRIPTPQPATPDDVANTIKEMVTHFNWKGKVACGFPALLHEDKCLSVSNLHNSWEGVNIPAFLKEKVGNNFTVVNDADAAGLAEIYFGAGKDVQGTVIMITLGTGIGSAIFLNGKLVPNTEFGHIYTEKGIIFEKYAADSIRKKEELSRKKWGKRLNKYFQHLELILSPSLIIIGGGASKKLEKFSGEIHTRCKVVAATNQNEAGIIGAALAAVN